MGKPVNTIFAIDVSDQNLWSAIASILVHAFVSWYLVKWECTYRKLALTLGGSRRHAGFVVSVVIFILGVIRHSCVFSAIHTQPRWILFHSNVVLLVGQLVLLAGLVILGSNIRARGTAQSLICIHYDLYGDSFRGDVFPYNVLNEPAAVSSVLIYSGLSLLSASMVGLLLSLLMLINHCHGQLFSPMFSARYLRR